MGQNKPVSLLDELFSKTDCNYLSDLHDSANSGKVLLAFRAVEPDKFELDEWREAFKYITGLECAAASVEALLLQLSEHLGEQP